MEACELLSVELRLDRIEAELASELPLHMRSFAQAHARGLPAPAAPDVLRRATTLATARAALVHPFLADRGLALLRLAAPVAIESHPDVRAAATAPATWAALAALTAARDAAATALFGRGAIEITHHLHGSAAVLAHAGLATGGSPVADAGLSASNQSAVDITRAVHGPAVLAAPAVGGNASPDAARTAVQPAPGARKISPPPAPDAAYGIEARADLPPTVAGWFEPDGITVDDRAIAEVWEAIRARHGVTGTLLVERAAGARPRAFIVEPGREVIVVIPARVAAPAERFAVLHELGHAVAALAVPSTIARVVDEAVAAYVARTIENEADPWYSPLAAAARSRRRALARVLDRIERALPDVPDAGARPAERPPLALWHDPGAQAAYVAAESLADAFEQAIGPAVSAGALAAELSVLRDRIDRASAGHAI